MRIAIRLSAPLLVSTIFVGSLPVAARSEWFCTFGERDTVKGETMACYTANGCRFAASLGAEPIKGYDVKSAPFALARGKIAGIVTPYEGMVARVRKVKGTCRQL